MAKYFYIFAFKKIGRVYIGIDSLNKESVFSAQDSRGRIK
jgi:hypothetical protein